MFIEAFYGYKIVEVDKLTIGRIIHPMLNNRGPEFSFLDRVPGLNRLRSAVSSVEVARRSAKVGKALMQVVRDHPRASAAIAALGTGVVIYEMVGDEENSGEFQMPESIASTKLKDYANEAEYFKAFERGEFSREDRAERKRTLAPGVDVFDDIGMTFYVVQRGDTLGGIRRKLSKLPQYAYLKDQPQKLESFNIPARELQAGMLIPIPLENDDRMLTDEQFAKYAYRALNDLLTDERYGPFLRKLHKEKSDEEIVAAMMAIAKQESGTSGKIGSLELHRWEPGHNKFSFSIFHVLMEGPGLKARRNLNMTEGQLYHPRNACKAFFAFMVEKILESGRSDSKAKGYLVKLFELGPEMATFYNGSAWRRTNPRYLPNIRRNYDASLKVLED